MKNKTVTYIIGIFLIAAGILFIISPKEIFKIIVSVGAIGIIGVSIVGVLLSIFGKKISSTYFLGSSILGIILGIVLITSTNVTIKVIPVLLGIWLFITGLTRIVYMSKLKQNLKKEIGSIARIILGLICFLVPIVPISIAGIYIGIVLVLSGINTITNIKNEEVIYKVKIKK